MGTSLGLLLLDLDGGGRDFASRISQIGIIMVHLSRQDFKKLKRFSVRKAKIHPKRIGMSSILLVLALVAEPQNPPENTTTIIEICANEMSAFEQRSVSRD